MQNKFQYILLGVGITLLAILGTMSIVLSRAEAKVSPDVTSATVALQQPAIQEGDNPQFAQEQSQISQLQMENSSLADTVEVLPSKVEVIPVGDTGSTDDLETIIKTVTAFASKQEENLFGGSGWIYERYAMESFLPEGQESQDYHLTTGETIPMESLAPSTFIFESWYHVNGDNTFFEGISLVSAFDGTIYQKSVLIGEDWVNLTLKEANAHSGQYTTRRSSNIVALPITGLSQTLENLSPTARVQAFWENDQYVVTIEYSYDEPLEDVAYMPEPIVGNKHIYAFDLKTGQLLTIDGYTLFQSNKWFHDLRMTYSPVEFQQMPPDEIVEIFTQATNDYTEEK